MKTLSPQSRPKNRAPNSILIGVASLMLSSAAFAQMDGSKLTEIIEGRALKQALKVYIESQTPELVNLHAQQGESLAKYFFGSTAAKNALLSDIKNSTYRADTSGTECQELMVAGSGLTPINAKTKVGERNADVCFNVKGLEADYGQRPDGEIMNTLIGYALHEHAHHFQSSPASQESDSPVPESLEQQAYQFQSYVAGSVTSGLMTSLQYSTPLSPSWKTGLRDLTPEQQNNADRNLVLGDQVILMGAKCATNGKVDRLQGLRFDFCASGNGDFLYGTEPIPQSKLAVVAVGGRQNQEALATGSVETIKETIVQDNYGEGFAPYIQFDSHAGLKNKYLDQRYYARSFGETKRHHFHVGDIGYIDVPYVPNWSNSVEGYEDRRAHAQEMAEREGVYAYTLQMKVRIVGINNVIPKDPSRQPKPDDVSNEDGYIVYKILKENPESGGGNLIELNKFFNWYKSIGELRIAREGQFSKEAKSLGSGAPCSGFFCLHFLDSNDPRRNLSPRSGLPRMLYADNWFNQSGFIDFRPGEPLLRQTPGDDPATDPTANPESKDPNAPVPN